MTVDSVRELVTITLMLNAYPLMARETERERERKREKSVFVCECVCKGVGKTRKGDLIEKERGKKLSLPLPQKKFKSKLTQECGNAQ